MRGVLIGGSVIVTGFEEARKLYSRGFYGTPIGVEKPRGAAFEAPLKLSIVEALYLAERGELEIVKPGGDSVSLEELKRLVSSDPRLARLYRVYRDLRDRGLVVRSGLKYGSDFTVYRRGPGLEHAPFIVTTYEKDEGIDPIELVRAGRVSHSVRKTFTLAYVEGGGTVRYVMFKWFKP